ncbi:DUF1657 domain-containing protein [Anaerobacillus sp. MEB173]|uniref:DUF1657 domain-containing protein n=1 Tax=Anaerobacillus sp. MEB173 TaxID=3383345 RepID=UPI003F925F9E
MTVASQVKQCLASLKSVESTLSTYALNAEDPNAKNTFHETCLITRRVIKDIEKRIGEMEFQEPEYKGF